MQENSGLEIQIKQAIWWSRAQIIGYIVMILVYIGQYYAIWYNTQQAKKWAEENILVRVNEMQEEYMDLKQLIEEKTGNISKDKVKKKTSKIFERLNK